MKIFNSLGLIALIVFAAVLLSSVTPVNGNRHNLPGQDVVFTGSSFSALAPVGPVRRD